MGESNQDQDQQTNLDTRAYETVKSRWIRDGIWDDDWTFVPGTSWRHERTRKTLDPQERDRREDARKAVRLEKMERRPRWYSMAPIAPLANIHWPSTKLVSLEAVSDPSSPSILEPSSQYTLLMNFCNEPKEERPSATRDSQRPYSFKAAPRSALKCDDDSDKIDLTKMIHCDINVYNMDPGVASRQGRLRDNTKLKEYPWRRDESECKEEREEETAGN